VLRTHLPYPICPTCTMGTRYLLTTRRLSVSPSMARLSTCTFKANGNSLLLRALIRSQSSSKGSPAPLSVSSSSWFNSIMPFGRVGNTAMRRLAHNTSGHGRIPLAPAPRVWPTGGNNTLKSSASATAAAAAAAQPLPVEATSVYARIRNRGPVSWTSLWLTAVAAATAVGYYHVERERRLEQALGKIVTSESDGWTPRPEFLAKRKYVQTRDGTWFPMSDGFGAREY
jgi:hypothetical protein